MKPISNKLIRFAVIAGVMTIPFNPVFAAKGDLPNGQPFQTLNAAIEDNTAAIEANTAAIAANSEAIAILDSRVTSLDSTVAAITSDLEALTNRVTQNSADIQALFNNDQMLADDLAALRDQHNSDMAEIAAAIDAVDARINVLGVEMDMAIADLNSRLDSLQSQFDTDVAALTAEVAGLLARIAILDNTLDTHSQDLAQLRSAQQSLTQQLAGLNTRVNSMTGIIDSLTGRVTTLEGYHVTIPQSCDTGRDPGTSSPWIVCSADQNEAWISANNSGTYHPEKICQDLGYRTVGQWGGTCGNVCGYCQGTTSCNSHGTKRFDRGAWTGAGNSGSDAMGARLAYTVTWTCVN